MSTPSASAVSAPAAHAVRPHQPAPHLTVALRSGRTYRLAGQHPASHTIVVFFRGLHYPVCRAQLTELNRRLYDLRDLGIEVVAVSGHELRLERDHDLAVDVSDCALVSRPFSRLAPWSAPAQGRRRPLLERTPDPACHEGRADPATGAPQFATRGTAGSVVSTGQNATGTSARRALGS